MANIEMLSKTGRAYRRFDLGGRFIRINWAKKDPYHVRVEDEEIGLTIPEGVIVLSRAMLNTRELRDFDTAILHRHILQKLMKHAHSIFTPSGILIVPEPDKLTVWVGEPGSMPHFGDFFRHHARTSLQFSFDPGNTDPRDGLWWRNKDTVIHEYTDDAGFFSRRKRELVYVGKLMREQPVAISAIAATSEAGIPVALEHDTLHTT